MIDYEQTAEAKKGRNGDKYMAHVAPGEMIVPPIISEELRAKLHQEMIDAGIDPHEYTVGKGMSINPATGLPEFGFLKKVVKTVAKFAGPIAALSGVGLPLSVAIGAGGGLLSGGGLKGALAGGLSGATLSGGGSLLGSGLGLSGGLGNAVGSGLLGAASGGITGGLKGALTGGVLGAAGGYLSTPGSTESLLGGDTFGHAAGSALGGSEGTGLLGSIGAGTVQGGTGAAVSSYGGDAGGSYASTDKSLLDRIGSGVSDAYDGVKSSLGFSNPVDDYTALAGQDAAQDAFIGPVGLSGKTASLGNSGVTSMAKSNNGLSSLLSGGLGTYSNDASEKALLEQQRNNQALFNPFLTASFNPGDLTADPGYQFQLEQGNKALDRKNAASGNYFSGGALQAAQDYGQGLASTTYGDAFTRFLQSQQQKLGAAGALAGVNDNIGNIKANSITNQNNLLSGVGAGLLGGTAYSNSGSILNNGNGDYLSQLLRQLQAQGNSSYGQG